MIRLVLVVLLIVAPWSSAAPATKPATQPAGGKRIVCFGDSITAKGYPEVMAKLLGGVEVVNAGVGGNTTAMALKRIDKDVLARKPDVVVIFFGTNDSRLAEPQVHVPVAQYEANLVRMIELCEKAGAKVVVCTPPPIDPAPYFKRHAKEKFDAAGGLAKVLGEYRAAALRAAESKKAAAVDLNQLMAAEPKWLRRRRRPPDRRRNGGHREVRGQGGRAAGGRGIAAVGEQSYCLATHGESATAKGPRTPRKRRSHKVLPRRLYLAALAPWRPISAAEGDTGIQDFHTSSAWHSHPFAVRFASYLAPLLPRLWW